VDSFPSVLQGDTTQSISDLLDGCGAAIQKLETGPEEIYAVEVTQPGTLSATVQDGAGVDIDVHIYSALETYHCEARHDTTVSLAVSCGTWYVVADTWSNGAEEFPGPYTITIDLAPSGGGCADWNQPFSPGGGVAEPCGFTGNPDLPFCNPNLGAWACLYTGEDSFCTYNCASDADCAADFSGGCCGDIQGLGDPQDFFCLTASLCQPVQPGEDTVPVEDTVGPTPDAHVSTDTSEPADQVAGEDTLLPCDKLSPPGEDTPESGVDSAPGTDRVEGDAGAGADASPSAPDSAGKAQATGDDSGGCAVVESFSSAMPAILLVSFLLMVIWGVRRRVRAG